MEILQMVVTLASIIAAIIAWTAKLIWSKEYRASKQAEIEALRGKNETLLALTENLKLMSSSSLWENYKSTKEGLESLISNQETEINSLKDKLLKVDSLIKQVIKEPYESKTDWPDELNEILSQLHLIRNLSEEIGKNTTKMKSKFSVEWSNPVPIQNRRL